MSLFQDLTNIANIIRQKKNIKRKMTLEEMIKVLESEENVLYLDVSSSDDAEVLSVLKRDWTNTEQNFSFSDEISAKALNAQAFYGDETLETLDLGSIEKIGAYACNNCKNLNQVIGEKVKIVQNNSFYYCSNLTVFSGSPEEIGDLAFCHCSSLKNFSFVNTQKIGERAFQQASSIEELIAPELESIGDYAFLNCTSLSSINLPQLKEIDAGAFSGCTLLQDGIFEGMVELKKYSFSYSSFINLTFPNLKKISSSAFPNSSVQNLYLPNEEIICELKGNYVPSTCNVYVPEKLLKDYQSSPFWGKLNLLSIQEE